MKIVGIISLAVGVLLVFTGFFVTPSFVASHSPPPPPSVPTLSFPTNGGRASGSSVTFTWEPATGAVDYRLQVFRSFTEPYDVFYTARVGNVTSKEIDGFPDDDTLFYWKVIAYNGLPETAVYRDWSVSKVWSFTNGPTPLPSPGPTLTYPTNLGAASGNSVTFVWEPATGAVDYRLQVFRSLTEPYGYFYNAGVGNVISKPVDAFPDDDTLFYWKVIAYDYSGTVESEVWSFTNGTPPPPSTPTLSFPPDGGGTPCPPSTPPTLSFPPGGGSASGNSVTFVWEPATGAVDYRLQVFRSLTEPYGYFYNAGVGNVTSKQIDGFPNDGTPFYWKVIAYNSVGIAADSVGIAADSEVWSFTSGRLLQVLRLLAVFIGVLAAVFGVNRIRRSRENRVFDFVSRLGGRLQTRRFYLPFCFACFFVALLIGLFTTQSGSGISNDSWQYISTGENVHYGNGFKQMFDQPYLTHPLYPVLIAGFMHLGLGGEQAASLIPILCFASLMFPLFFLGKTINGVFTGYVGCLACLALTPLVWVGSFAWTEMPYILFSVLAILFLTKFAEGSEAKNKMLCVSALFTALAILTRYMGLTLLLVGLIVIVVENKTRFKKMVCQTSLFGLISCIPLILWLYRNYTLAAADPSRFVWAESHSGALFAIVNRSVEIILSDLFAGLLPQQVELFLLTHGYILLAVVPICFVLLALCARIHPTRRKVFLEYLGKNYVAISYVFIYITSYILIMSFGPVRPISSRYLLPVYALVILIAVSFIFYAYRQVKKPRLKPTLFSIITIFCVLFLATQASSTFVFCQTAKHGQYFNAPVFRNSQAIAWIATNVPDDAHLHSNYGRIIGYRLGRKVEERVPSSGYVELIDEWVETVSKDRPEAFIVVFKGIRPDLLQSSDFKIMNQKHDVEFVVLADFPEATIWGVRQAVPSSPDSSSSAP